MHQFGLQFLEPGEYVLDNGKGGTDVGPFQVTLTVPETFRWKLSPGTVNVTWSGGNPAGYVIIQGSGTPTLSGVNADFTCTERVAAGQFAIPDEVMLSLTPGSGSRGPGVFASSPVITVFRATGLDIGQFSYGSAIQ